MRPSIYITQPVAESAIERLRKVAEVEVNPDASRVLNNELMIAAVRKHDILFALLHDTIDRDVIAANPRLRAIASMALNPTNIDVKEATARKIPVLVIAGAAVVETTADITFALLLATARNVPQADRFLRGGGFPGAQSSYFLGAAVFGVFLMILVRTVPGLQISIDFTKSLSFETAPATIFSPHLAPGRLPAAKDGPVSITAEFQVDPSRRSEFIKATRGARLIFLRNGAYRWHLYEDLKHPNKFRMEVVVPSWKQHLLQIERMTKNEREVIDNLRALRSDPNPPEEWISLSVEKEVLTKRVRAGGLPPGYINQ